MKKLILTITCVLTLFGSCNYVTVRDHTKKSTETESTNTETEAQKFIKNAAAMQYIDYATVLNDTAYIGIPSRRGLPHGQDNMARIFLSDLRKSGNFLSIKCCKVINTASDFVWNDSIVSGQVIGLAEATD